MLAVDVSAAPKENIDTIDMIHLSFSCSLLLVCQLSRLSIPCCSLTGHKTQDLFSKSKMLLKNVCFKNNDIMRIICETILYQWDWILYSWMSFPTILIFRIIRANNWVLHSIFEQRRHRVTQQCVARSLGWFYIRWETGDFTSKGERKPRYEEILIWYIYIYMDMIYSM